MLTSRVRRLAHQKSMTSTGGRADLYVRGCWRVIITITCALSSSGSPFTFGSLALWQCQDDHIRRLPFSAQMSVEQVRGQFHQCKPADTLGPEIASVHASTFKFTARPLLLFCLLCAIKHHERKMPAAQVRIITRFCLREGDAFYATTSSS